MELFYLSAESIMTATEKVFTFLSEHGIDRRDALRLQLAAEEVLLTYQQKFGEDTPFELYMEKRLKTPRIILRVTGNSCDPFGNLSEDDRVMRNLMENMGTVPVWTYRHSCNEVVFTAGKKKTLSSLVKMLFAIAMGIGLGLIFRLLPGTIAHDISEIWLAPVQNAVMGFLSCLSALFVLLSVTSGICSMGDVSTFNRVGRNLIFRLLLILLIDTALAAIALPFFFPLSGGATGTADFSALWQMLVDIIPTNIVETFSTGNTMQIVFLAMFASTILLVMGPKAQQLVDIITQLSNLIQQLIQNVIALMPVVVFISLFRLNADGDITQLISAYKYPLFFFLFCAAYIVVHVVITSLHQHISPFLLVKKLIPTLLIAASTASSAAALPENLNTCENRLGIDRQIINVGISLGQTIYMPSVVMTMLIAALCSAQIFNVPISLPSYLILVAASYIIAIATPPVPGALMASFALLLTQMGLPSDAMVFVVALDAIIDRIGTATYVAGLQMELTNIAKSLNLLDEQKLHAAE